MTHGSRTPAEYRHGRTIFIAGLVVIGVCLFVATAWLSLYVPVAVENDGSLIEGLHQQR